MIIEASSLKSNINTKEFLRNSNSLNFINKNDKLKNIVNKINSNNKIEQSSINKIDIIKNHFRLNVLVEKELQDNMSYLQKREQDLFNITDKAKRIQELGNLYNKSSLNDEEKNKIIDETNKLLLDIENIMNDSTFNGYRTMDKNYISINSSSGRNGILELSKAKVVLDKDSVKEYHGNEKLLNSNFENRLGTEAILKSSSIIQDKLLNPLKGYMDEVNDYKSAIYNQFMEEKSEAVMNIEELFKSGEISEYMRDLYMKMQGNMSDSITSIRFQTANLNASNVFALLN